MNIQNKYIFLAYTKHTMKRFNFFIEQETLDRLEEKRARYGHSGISSFIRYILNDFLNKES